MISAARAASAGLASSDGEWLIPSLQGTKAVGRAPGRLTHTLRLANVASALNSSASFRRRGSSALRSAADWTRSAPERKRLELIARNELLDQPEELSFLEPDVGLEERPDLPQEVAIDDPGSESGLEATGEPVELHVLAQDLREERRW